MSTVIAGDDQAKVKVDRPEHWFFIRKCVPTLRVPRELFGISNRPITPVPDALEQPRPMIATLDSASMFLWCYYQRPGDPDPENLNPIPDYSRYTLPLDYRLSETFPAFDAREWRPSDFLWRRIGFHVGGIAISVFIWEGTAASAADVKTAEQVLATVAPV